MTNFTIKEMKYSSFPYTLVRISLLHNMDRMKSILTLGGTGPTGLLTVHTAIQCGHNVAVFARNPKKIPNGLFGEFKCHRLFSHHLGYTGSSRAKF
jgi:hypothetical protein